MESITDLQNTILELQDIVDNTLASVFNDLSNSSQVFTPVIESHNTITQKIDEMIDYLNSGLVVGLKGDQGLQGEKGDAGANASLSFKRIPSDKSFGSTTYVVVPEFSLNYLAGEIYEIDFSFVWTSNSAITVGVKAKFDAPNAKIFGDLNMSITTANAGTAFHRFVSGESLIEVITTGVSAVTAKHYGKSRFILECVGNGTLKFSFAAEVSGNVYLYAPSTLFYKKLQVV